MSTLPCSLAPTSSRSPRPHLSPSSALRCALLLCLPVPALPCPALPSSTLSCCRSKGGNNNTYCHDSPLNYLDWGQAAADEAGLLRFTRHMIALRRVRASCGAGGQGVGGGGTGCDVTHPALM